MPEVTNGELLDLVNGTFRDFEEPKFHQIATRLPRYEVSGRLLRKEKRMERAGTGISESILTDHSNSAQDSSLHAVKQYNVQDLMAQMEVLWKQSSNYFAWERREALMNMNPKRIYNVLKTKEVAALISMAEYVENRFWSSPADYNDKKKIYGIFYWLTYNATYGINGGNHAGFPLGKGNINANTYTRWKNGTANYSKISKGDGIAKLRDLGDDCNFESPVDVPDLRKGRGDQWRLYCGRDTKRAFENVGEQQNENLGKDIASMDGQIVFRKNPIIRVPQLDGRASAPVIGLNWDWIKFGVLKGDYMRRSEARFLSDQPNTMVVDYDLSWNLVFLDLRSQFLMAKSDPLSD